MSIHCTLSMVKLILLPNRNSLTKQAVLCLPLASVDPKLFFPEPLLTGEWLVSVCLMHVCTLTSPSYNLCLCFLQFTYGKKQSCVLVKTGQ